MERTRQTVDPKIAALFPLWQRAGYSLTTTSLAFGYSEYLVQKHCESRKWGDKVISSRVSRILRRKVGELGALENLYWRYRFIRDRDRGITEPVMRLGLGIKQTANIGCLTRWLAMDKEKDWARERVALLTWELANKERTVAKCETVAKCDTKQGTGDGGKDPL